MNKRIFTQMLSLIEKYKNGKIGFQYLVNSLYGCLDALNGPISETFYESWYLHFVSLDTILALDNENTENDLIIEELNALEALIKQWLINV